jgi:hypothetical protein
MCRHLRFINYENQTMVTLFGFRNLLGNCIAKPNALPLCVPACGIFSM